MSPQDGFSGVPPMGGALPGRCSSSSCGRVDHKRISHGLATRRAGSYPSLDPSPPPHPLPNHPQRPLSLSLSLRCGLAAASLRVALCAVSRRSPPSPRFVCVCPNTVFASSCIPDRDNHPAACWGERDRLQSAAAAESHQHADLAFPDFFSIRRASGCVKPWPSQGHASHLSP